MRSDISKNVSLLILSIAFIAFVYVTVKVMHIVNKRQISTGDAIYTNHVTTSQEIEEKAFSLIEGCESERCEVQRVLDYVTHIPYKINHFKANSPQRTIQNNFGDCDDKSNLLISMLHALKKEAYFVLVPKHIFIIAAINDETLRTKKGLWLDGKKYYILESTAEGSSVGYPLHYKVSEIKTIFEPFENRKIEYENIAYKL